MTVAIASLCLLLGAPAVQLADGLRPERIVLPGYPRYARADKLEVVLSVRVQVAASGLVTGATEVKADVTRASKKTSEANSFVFLETLLPAVWQWKYPAGRSTRYMTLRFVYRLVNVEERRNDEVIFRTPADVEVIGYVYVKPK